MSAVVETVGQVIGPIVEENQLELVDIEFVKEGKTWFLRIFVDKPNGIDIEEIAIISEKISEALDSIEPDPIPQAYFLDVSSPGAERPLKTEQDIVNAIGSYINISLYQPIDGNKQFEGDLITVTPDELTIEYMNKTRKITQVIPRKSIAKTRKAIKF